MKRFLLIVLIIISFNAYTQNFNLTYRSKLRIPGQTIANIWGYVDGLGNEYALAGASQGLSIINVTNPASPFEVSQVLWPVQNGGALWKEVKTWGNYAYVTSEAGMGLQIINLSNLPGTSLPSKQWQPVVNGIVLNSIHALHIDNGYAYLYGSNCANGGVVIADLSDPWNPTVAGYWDYTYIHDGYVRNDTIYAGAIYMGMADFIDATDKANPMLVQSQTTPSSFTHNTWLSDDSKTLFTTDEVNNSVLAAFDISDINNITEVDRFATTPGSGSIVHNTHILNDYAVNSWYRDGIDIVDAHRPGNLVEVARYDTYPQGAGGDYNGAWGVYPFLPSGNIVVSNIDDGTLDPNDNDSGAVYVFTPNYVRASYVEGIVTDSVTGNPITGASVQLAGTTSPELTKISGTYATGIASSGFGTINVSKFGYQPRTISGVSLIPGVVNILNIKLKPFASGINNIQLLNATIQINPNPSEGIFHIDFSLPASAASARFEITDITGRVVDELRVDDAGGSIVYNSTFKPGVYFISLVYGGEHTTPVKIVKTR